MALRQIKDNIMRMFNKNLADLVRGLRNSEENEDKYIAQCMEEIKRELQQENVAVKATAVAKLTYLQMLGYDISWAGFNIIEVMNSSKFIYKRIGYLSSSQSFHANTGLLMLTTNMVRKDLNSQNQYDVGVTLSALACFISPDLARVLASDIMTLLSSTKPYLRKKAVLMMYKVFLCFPEALQPAFPRLKDKLVDIDCGVQSAAVNVFSELARKNPKKYLSLAPVFFKLLTSSTNNWMLIKTIRLFGALAPLEPRLGKKLIEPLTNLIHCTPAMSVLYESINTMIIVLNSISSEMPNHSAFFQLCVQKLKILIENSDKNLKYLSLVVMSKILKTHSKSVQAYEDLIIGCLDEKDESIRLQALDLLCGMISKENLMKIVEKLMVHIGKANCTICRDKLIVIIVDVCSQDNYHFITCFQWYVRVLVALAQVEGIKQGPLLAYEMLNVADKVQAIRPFAVSQMTQLLKNAHMCMQPFYSSNMVNVLFAAVCICGEYAYELEKPDETLYSMLSDKVHLLPCHIQTAYLQNMMKVVSIILSKRDTQQSIEVCKQVSVKLAQYMFMCSEDLEVQERAIAVLQLIFYIDEKLENSDADEIYTNVTYFLNRKLNSVVPNAQRKLLQVPKGLDLDQWINKLLQSSLESDDNHSYDNSNFCNLCGFKEENVLITTKQVETDRKSRLQKLENISDYLRQNPNNDKIVGILVSPTKLMPLNKSGFAFFDKYLKDKKSYIDKKKSKKKNKEQNHFEEEYEKPVIEMVGNRDIKKMPNGREDSNVKANVQEGVYNINLDIPEIEYPLTVEKRKLKKKKNEMKIQKVKLKKSKKIDKNDQQLIEIKQEYKEALGICTTPKEIIQAEDSPFCKLLMDKYLLLEYKINPKSELRNLATVFFRLTNLGNNCLINNIEIVMTNSTGIQFLDSKSEPLSWYKLSSTIQCGSLTEFDLSLQVENITIPNTLQGTLTYMLQIFQEDNLYQDKLDWQLHVKVSNMFLKVSPSVPLVEQIYNGQLVYKSSVIVPDSIKVNLVINWFCTLLNLVLVEHVGEAALFYGSTASGEQLCLLVKCNANKVAVEAKCTSQTLIDNFMKEIEFSHNYQLIFRLCKLLSID